MQVQADLQARTRPDSAPSRAPSFARRAHIAEKIESITERYTEVDKQRTQITKRLDFVKGDGVDHYHFVAWATILDEHHIQTTRDISLDKYDLVFIENKGCIIENIDHHNGYIIYTITKNPGLKT